MQIWATQRKYYTDASFTATWRYIALLCLCCRHTFSRDTRQTGSRYASCISWLSFHTDLVLTFIEYFGKFNLFFARCTRTPTFWYKTKWYISSLNISRRYPTREHDAVLEQNGTSSQWIENKVHSRDNCAGYKRVFLFVVNVVVERRRTSAHRSCFCSRLPAEGFEPSNLGLKDIPDLIRPLSRFCCIS